MKALLLLLLIPAMSFGQYKRGLIPRSSTPQGISQKVGYTQVDLSWNSPSVKGRTIWGDLVPYDEIWRAGANSATTVQFSTPVKIGGETIAAGKYALFIIPSKHHQWTIILNSDSEQWGTYNYSQTKDVLRFKVSPQHRSQIAEQVSMSIQQSSFLHGSFTFSWEFIDLVVPFETDFVNSLKQEVESSVEKAVENAKWAPYLQAAEYLIELEMNLDLAQEWITKSETLYKAVKEWDSRYMAKEFVNGHFMWVKAKLLSAKGEVVQAIELADKMIADKQAKAYYESEYNKSTLDEMLAKWRASVKK